MNQAATSCCLLQYYLSRKTTKISPSLNPPKSIATIIHTEIKIALDVNYNLY